MYHKIKVNKHANTVNNVSALSNPCNIAATVLSHLNFKHRYNFTSITKTENIFTIK